MHPVRELGLVLHEPARCARQPGLPGRGPLRPARARGRAPAAHRPGDLAARSGAARAAAAQREPPVAARRARPLRGVRHEHERDRARRHADGRTRRQYVCARHYSAGSCPAPASIAGTLLEPYVEDIAFELLRSRRRPPAAKVREAERKVATLQAALIAYRDSTRLQSVLDEDTFADGLAVRSRRVERALLELAGARSPARRPRTAARRRTRGALADDGPASTPRHHQTGHRLRDRRPRQRARPGPRHRLPGRLRTHGPSAPRRQARAAAQP